MVDARFGLIGLGTMGRMLALNMAEKGFPLAVYNRTAQVTRDFFSGAGTLQAQLVPCESLKSFLDAISAPRTILIMVPAGETVDQQIRALRAHTGDDDLIIDCGNANFHDTERRARDARAAGERFMGVGLSGGEYGARHGPAIMAGGCAADWEAVAPLFNAIAARHGDEPCAAHMGPDGAGHFVKAVHNGIEYADMQLICEAYGVMRDGLNLDSQGCAAVFERWNGGDLRSYLVEISAKIAAARDPQTGRAMLDIIEDRAGQKGTGRWTVIEAQHLGAPVPVIEAAVAARNISAGKEARIAGAQTFAGPGNLPGRPHVASLPDIDDIEAALIAGKILCYSQGFELLRRASAACGWDLPMPAIAELWREGCIIRSAMLDDMASALRTDASHSLMQAARFSALLQKHIGALRRFVAHATLAGYAVPAASAAISYFDAMRTARSTANLLQGQRDFFGAHGFERVDRAGADFHGPWAM